MTEADERSAYEIRRYSSSTLLLLRFLALALIGSLAACMHNRAIDRWLMCDECMEGELDSVVALESGAVERLTNTLGGPPPDRAENMRRRFSASYGRLVARSGPQPMGMTEAEYVGGYFSNYVATYQGRSAIALGRIGTQDAVTALRNAEAQPALYREDVRQEIRQALAGTMAVSGNNQMGLVGTTLSDSIEILVTDGLGSPVGAVPVRYTIESGNGVLLGGGPTGDGSGKAFVWWTLGPVPGTQSMRITAGEQTAIIEATANAAPGLVLTLSAVRSQSAPAGDAAPIVPAVLVTNGSGTPVANENVTFAVILGGGSVTGTPTPSNVSGIASLGSWTLGPALGGLNTLVATISSAAPSERDSVEFLAVGTRQPPASIATSDGNNQVAVVNTTVPTAPSVLIEDASNNAIPGVPVAFSAFSGGGAVTGAIQNTDPNGVATVGSWILGSQAGVNRLHAMTLNLPGVTFTATAVPFATVPQVVSIPQSILVDNGSTVEVLVEARDALNQAVQITSVSQAAGASITVVRDFLHQSVFHAGATDAASCAAIPNSSWTGSGCLVPRPNPTRLRYEITGTIPSATSFSVTLNGMTLAIPVTVTPLVVPVAQGGSPSVSGGATIVQLAAADPKFAFEPTSSVSDAGGSEFLVVAMPIGNSHVPFVPTPGSSGVATINNVLFMPVSGLSLSLPTDIAIIAPASTFSGHTSSGSPAGPITIPPSGSSDTVYDGWTSGASDQHYFYNLPAMTTIVFELDWSNSADMDLVMTDNPPTTTVCGFGGATGAQPEVLTCTNLVAGSYQIRVTLFSGSEPGVVKIRMITQ